MRWLLCLPFLAACGSTGPKSTPEPFRADQLIRVVNNQYRGVNTVFVLENLAGRDQVALRSQPLRAGEPAVAYVPDDRMAALLDAFERADFYDYARPRPANPPGLGATGEITVTDASGRRLALLRVPNPPGLAPTRDQIDAARAYTNCKNAFHDLWTQFPPQMQAMTGSGDPFQTKPKTSR